MGIKECQIYFDNDHSTYYAGQTISGRVDLKLDSIKKVRVISIAFKGEANVNWTTTETRKGADGKSHSHTVHLTGEEEYFKTKYNLVSSSTSDAVELQPGDYTYTFTCVLPPTLPSSFEGDYGSVRYTVKVVLNRPWKFDQETKAIFTVLSHVDLNLTPRLRERAQLTVEKTFCCCFCKSGPLTCVVTLPCSGYVCGQTIPIVCEVDNISSIEVESIRFELKKVVQYHSRTPRRETKVDEKKIMELTVEGVGCGQSRTIEQSLVLPALPPSNLTNCSLVDLDYALKITLIVSGCHQNMSSSIPITIGTIPLIGRVEVPPRTVDSIVVNLSQNVHGMPIPQPAGGIGWQTPGISKYPETPPPSYQQCQFGAMSINDNSDNQYTKCNAEGYAPMYPVYNYSTISPSAPPLPPGN